MAALESLLTWVERVQRTAWGRAMLALIGAAATLVWAWLEELPGPVILVVLLSVFVLLLIALPYGLMLGKALAPFPFSVSVPTVGTSTQSFQAHILILNRRPGNRVLTIQLCCKPSQDAPGNWYQQLEIDKLRDHLGPQEKTEGVISLRRTNTDLPSGEWYLCVSDMVSQRRTPLFKIPGCYPPNSWLISNQIPRFTKTPDEVLEIKRDFGGELR